MNVYRNDDRARLLAVASAARVAMANWTMQLVGRMDHERVTMRVADVRTMARAVDALLALIEIGQS